MNAPFPAHHATIAALREENDILRETVRQLREELAPHVEFPPAWKLSPQQTLFLSCVLAAAPGTAKQSRILKALWGDRDAPETAVNAITVTACQLRQRLRTAGVQGTIQNIYGVGYRISQEDRDRILVTARRRVAEADQISAGS